MKKLLLIGAGHAHAEVLRQFGEHPAANAAITLVSLQRQFPYAGMFPGLVAGHYTHAQFHIDLVPVAARAGIEFVVGRINAIDADKRIASTAGGRDFEFDFASIDVGSMPLVPDIPGLRQFALLMDGLRPLLDDPKTIQRKINRATTDSAPAVDIETIGPGV